MREPLLTAREVAERLGVSASALLRWTRAGQVPAVKLPSGAVRYRPEQIEAWLAARAMGTAGEEASTTITDRTHAQGYASVRCLSSTTRPEAPAATEEDPDGS
jgi:excisionase family DNA binding protein